MASEVSYVPIMPVKSHELLGCYNWLAANILLLATSLENLIHIIRYMNTKHIYRPIPL